MKTEMTCVRLAPEVKAALKAAALAEDRPVAYVIERATIEWLRKGGWLKLGGKRK
jgi:predicted transcriptional regulator